MKYVNIFLLHFQRVFEHRARSFVWFLVPLFDVGLLILFWSGALKENTIANVSFSSIGTYYLFLVILDVLLTSHVEEDIAREDIREGKLTQYLIRPISYYWVKFFEEIPFRILQGSYGIVILSLFVLLFGKFFTSVTDPIMILFSFVIAVFAYFIRFTYKMIIGILAFWVLDIGGFFQFQEMLSSIFAGALIPLYMYPQFLVNIAQVFPFAYMLYFPVISFQGLLSFDELMRVIGMQVLWLSILITLYIFLWNRGIKRYSAVGQ